MSGQEGVSRKDKYRMKGLSDVEEVDKSANESSRHLVMQDSSIGVDGIQIEVAENNLDEDSEYEVHGAGNEEEESMEGEGDQPDMDLAINKHAKQLLMLEKKIKRERGIVDKKVTSP